MSCSSVEVDPKACSIEGSATFTFERSRIVSAATATHTQYARQRFWGVSGISCVSGAWVIVPTLRPHEERPERCRRPLGGPNHIPRRFLNDTRSGVTPVVVA